MTTLTTEQRERLAEFVGGRYGADDSPLSDDAGTPIWVWDHNWCHEDEWNPDDENAPAWQAALVMDMVRERGLGEVLVKRLTLILIDGLIDDDLNPIALPTAAILLAAPNHIKMQAVLEVL